jgi:hypothetical protein
MTQPQDDKALDEYLQRDSAVSQHYRNLDADAVPPALDSAVLAQASEALRASNTKRKPAWTRWSAPLALAATVVLGVGIVLQIGVDERIAVPSAQVEMTAGEVPARDAASSAAIEQVTQEPQVFSEEAKLDAPAPAPASPQPAAPRQARERSESRANEAKREAAISAQRVEEPVELLTQDVAPPPAATVSAPVEEEMAVTSSPSAEPEKRAFESRADQTITAQAANQRAMSSPADVAASAVVNRPQASPAAPRLNPEEWLQQIRALRRDGKVLEADAEWRQFVSAYPTFVVKADDLARPKP